MRGLARQSGATLIVGLIMLLMTSVSLIAAYNMTQTSQIIVQNLQSESTATDLANSTLESAISTTRLVNVPNAVFLVACGGTQNAQCYDINGDGGLDVTVTLTPDPFCIRDRVIPNGQLNLPAQSACLVGGNPQFGIAGAANQDSLCADTLWEVSAVANDVLTGTTERVTGHYSIEVSAASAASFCI